MLISRVFWKHLGFLALASFLVLAVVQYWLKRYTHHGQKIEMPDYIGQDVGLSMDHAAGQSFKMIVTDSIFIVGKKGGIILSQMPHPGDIVKQDRTIYVTVSKYEANKIKVSQLPILYGKNFERKKRELKQGYELNAKVIGKRYDPGPPDHILMAIYGRDTIVSPDGRKEHVELPTGATIKFILSKRRGGLLEMPDLLCKTYGEATFLLESYQANVKVFDDGNIEDLGTAYVWKQFPPANSSKTVEMGSDFELYITQTKPSFCP